MIYVAKIQDIKEICVIAIPSWKDYFKQALTQIKKLPATYFIGKSWELKHSCANCNQDIVKKGDFTEDSITKYLSVTSISNVRVLEIFGSLFELNINKGVKADNSGEYYYYTLPVRTMPLKILPCFTLFCHLR